MLDYGPVSCRVDLDAPGKRSGWLDLSHSDNRHDFSTIPVPVGIVRGVPLLDLDYAFHSARMDVIEGKVLKSLADLRPVDTQGTDRVRIIEEPELDDLDHDQADGHAVQEYPASAQEPRPAQRVEKQVQSAAGKGDQEQAELDQELVWPAEAVQDRQHYSRPDDLDQIRVEEVESAVDHGVSLS